MRYLFFILLFTMPIQLRASIAPIVVENQSTSAFYIKRLETKSGIQDPEKPSAAARASLWLFLASFVIVALGNQLPFFIALVLTTLLGSAAFAIYVLFAEKNKKSRKLARIILGIQGVIIGAAFLILLLVNSFQRKQG